MAQVLIVSNRLPVSVKKKDGALEFSASIGGLATGLSSYVKDRKNKWIGWPGLVDEELTERDKRQIIRELAKHSCVPVFLSRKEVDEFYNGYSNGILWPLFHNLPFDEISEAKHKRWWHAYGEVNKLFAEAVLEEADSDSRIWVHDYQLMLLPQLLRNERPVANIGFFLHIPFPPAQGFMQLPEANKLLFGVLGADLTGFHTPSYVAHFSAACGEMPGLIVTEGQVVVGSRSVRIADFPMGIDYEKYAEASKSKAVKEARKRFERKYRGKRVIAAVDRLDISKGLVERLEAYRDFLRAHPQQHGKVIMAMVAAPSRTDIDAYKRLKDRLDSLAQEINEEFGRSSWEPLDYMDEAKPFEEVTALFQVADVAFIAPLRDGMNLVAKEYVASKRGNGVLILSETAGAAEELRDALLVNPRKPASSVEALQQALTMPPRELKRRLKRMQDQIATNTVHNWAKTFVGALNQPLPGTPYRTLGLSGSRYRKLAQSYTSARKRLILLDYDGTLVRINENYSKTKPSKAMLETVRKLAADPANEVVIVSGRQSSYLEKAFSGIPVHLVAEHGAMFRGTTDEKWQTVDEAESEWKQSLIPILQEYTALTPNSMVEVKPHSLVWHYRQSPPYYAQKYAVVLKRTLEPLLKRHGLALFRGNKILEIKNPHITKGAAIRRFLKRKHDFILVMGDDYTDEDMFKAVPIDAWSVKIDTGRTGARFRLGSPSDVLMLLRTLVH